MRGMAESVKEAYEIVTSEEVEKKLIGLAETPEEGKKAFNRVKLATRGMAEFINVFWVAEKYAFDSQYFNSVQSAALKRRSTQFHTRSDKYMSNVKRLEKEHSYYCAFYFNRETWMWNKKEIKLYYVWPDKKKGEAERFEKQYQASLEEDSTDKQNWDAIRSHKHRYVTSIIGEEYEDAFEKAVAKRIELRKFLIRGVRNNLLAFADEADAFEAYLRRAMRFVGIKDKALMKEKQTIRAHFNVLLKDFNV